MTMEFITLLLAIITALLLMPHINRFVKLARVKVRNYDSDIEESKKEVNAVKEKIASLEKSIQDLIILQGKESERTTLLTQRFDAVADDVYNAIFMGTEFVREKLTPKKEEEELNTKDYKKMQDTLEDKDMFQPLRKFKKKRRKYKKTTFAKPTRETIEYNMPVKYQRGKGYSKKAQEKDLAKVRKSAGYKKEYNKIYATLYAKRYYQYKKTNTNKNKK